MSGDAVTIEKISDEEAWRIFDSAARRLMNMSGDELARRWDNGEFADSATPELMRVLVLRPSGR